MGTVTVFNVLLTTIGSVTAVQFVAGKTGVDCTVKPVALTGHDSTMLLNERAIPNEGRFPPG